MIDWRIGSYQLVWFKPSVERIHAHEFYEKVFGEMPDTSQANRAPTPNAPFLSMAKSERGPETYTAQVAPGRIDFFWQASNSADEAFPSMPQTLDHVSEVVKRVGASISGVMSGVTRVAFVANLVSPTEGVDHVARQLAEFCELEPDSLDVSLQLNRRRPFGFDASEQMNRLLRAQMLQSQLITLGVQAIESGGMTPTFGTSFASHFMIDLNCFVTGKEYPTDAQTQMFNEFASEFSRIARAASIREALR